MRSRQLIIPFLIIVLSITLLSLRLGYPSLHPWDEAWYGSIARNVLDGHWLNLQYNGSFFWDQPPLGFYFMALSYQLFGINEFTTRLPSVIFATLCLVGIYFTGKRLINSYAGLCAAAILFSSRWFLLRARTGNLDILLALLQLIFFYLCYTASTRKRLYLAWFILGLSLLSKTTISFVLLPLVIIPTLKLTQGRSRKYLLKTVTISLICLLVPLIPWYGFNLLRFGLPFIMTNVFQIGLRAGSIEGLGANSLIKIFSYYHAAVNRWYLLTLFSFFTAFAFIKHRSIRWLILYLVLITLPFLISPKAQIWHLIPIMIPAALLIASVMILITQTLIQKFKLKGTKTTLAYILPCLIIFSLAIHSWVNYLPELYPYKNPSISDQAALAKAASSQPYPIVLKELDDYLPVFVFYSSNQVYDYDTFNFQEPYQLVTDNTYLRDHPDYPVVTKTPAFSLVLVNP